MPKLPTRRTTTWSGLLLAVFVGGEALAAATLKGVVVLNRERGEPVAGASVSADGANQTSTNSDGSFLLFFPSGEAGQDTRVIVTHSGGVVVNDIQLLQRLPKDPNARPLEIIICKSAERQQWAFEFYRLKGNQAVEQRFRRLLAELEGRQSATAQERDRLSRERDQARGQAEELARQLATPTPAVASGSYREALRLFLDGDVDAALQRLSEDRLRREAAEAQKKLEDAAQSWLLRGKLLALRFDFDGAGRAYGDAVKLAPGSYDAWFQHGYFHQQQNHYPEARRGYERALALAREAGDQMNIALTLNNLGILHRNANRMADARTAYEEALGIYRKQAQKNPEVYLPYVAATFNNLGVLHSVENRKADARMAYEEALAIRRTLAQKNPDVYLPDVAMTLNNLGVLHRDENRNADARTAFEGALGIYRNQAQRNPEVYLPDVATTLNNLGVLYSDENRMADARTAYEEARDIYRRFVAVAPAAYEAYLQTVEKNLAALPK